MPLRTAGVYSSRRLNVSNQQAQALELLFSVAVYSIGSIVAALHQCALSPPP